MTTQSQPQAAITPKPAVTYPHYSWQFDPLDKSGFVEITVQASAEQAAYAFARVGSIKSAQRLCATLGSHAALVEALRNVSQDLADCGSVQPDTLAMIPAALNLAQS